MNNRILYRTRRVFLWAGLVLMAVLGLAACGGQAPSQPTSASPATPTPQSPTAPPTSAPLATATSAPAQTPTRPAPTAPPVTPTAQAQVAPPTPACAANLVITPSQTEGPYYTPNTPQRTSLVEPGMSGTRVIVTGYVLTRDCKPIAGAWLDFWQADDIGAYDNTGFKLRGHQFTDAAGRYSLETVLPGLYPGRTRHIHVKVQAPNQPVLTTQLYFPGETQNQRDSIFNQALIVNMRDGQGVKLATFDFVLNVR